eukprot:13862240-Alexandrium_andersonii.AAC.1
MSASLVGSEMCIRDRGKPARDIAADAAKRREARSGGVRAFASLCNPAPVSYTHLTLPTICSV